MNNWLLSKMKDEALMKSYQAGNVQAFNILYARHKAKVFSFLRRQCNDTQTAEDLAHDSWLGVISQSSQYQTTAKFTTWVFRIAHNKLVDHWRKHQSRTQPLINQLSELKLEQTASSKNASDEAQLNELIGKLDLLPANQLEALLLKIEGFSHKEIADITQSKHETVKSRLRYATRQLKSTLELNA